MMALRTSARVAAAHARRPIVRALATFEDSGLPAITKNDDEIIVRTPFIGDNIFHAEMGELYEFTVAVGDVVAADDTIAVVDTHKASIDIRTPHSGTVARLLVDAGTEVYESHPVLALTGPSANPRVRMK